LPNPSSHALPRRSCSDRLVIQGGTAIEPKTGKEFFLDYPCGLKKGDKVTFILSLHGFGSYGNWMRHYFPMMDYKDKYHWSSRRRTPPHLRPSLGSVDDAYLQNIVDLIYDQVGKENVKAFWLVGHSQGGMTSNRLVRTPYSVKRWMAWLVCRAVAWARIPVAAISLI